MTAPRTLLRSLFDAAVAAADPAQCVPPNLPAPPRGRTVVVGAGKAAAAMARAMEDHWRGDLSGLVVTRYGHAVPTGGIEVVEAGHPLPDTTGTGAARRILDLATGLTADDLLICLISGGGSALLSLPSPGVSLADKRAVNDALLRAGAPIGEINAVRKHLSAIKGGRLALAAAPAKVVTLIISDVPGDDPATVASGPTVADPTTRDDALAVLAKYGIEPPDAVMRHLGDPASETPKTVAGAEIRIIARARDALDAAAAAAREAGYEPVILGDDIEGEARDVARVHAALARERTGPCALISGGETTVTLAGKGGRGGRNTEYALSQVLALDGAAGIHAIACDTDGIDGESDAAGAMIGPDTLVRARALGLDPETMLDAHDSYGFFDRLGDLVTTGPTRTNVNDFRTILIEPA